MDCEDARAPAGPAPSLRQAMAALAALLALSGCAATSAGGPGRDAPSAVPAIHDPFEPVNRGVFWVNEGLDRVVIRPAAEIYRAVLPDPLRQGVRNVLQNLRAPLDFANQVLQGDWDGAGTVLGRFALNTTVGLGGLFDVAAQQGLTYEYESFDQTLAVWGVPQGPYLVLPVIGSSTLRDGPALFAETWADPVRLFAANNEAQWFNWSRYGATVVDTRAGYIEVIDDLRTNAFDYYAAMRSLYLQRRDGWIRDGVPEPDAFPEIPDYDRIDSPGAGRR